MQNCSAGKLTRAGRVVFYTPCFQARDLAKQGEAQRGQRGINDTKCFIPDMCNGRPFIFSSSQHLVFPVSYTLKTEGGAGEESLDEDVAFCVDVFSGFGVRAALHLFGG